MNFHVLTLFPALIEPYFKESILGKAIEKKLIRLTTHQLRDYATDKHKRVDDSPYGGGAGMVLKVDVVVSAVRDIKTKHNIDRVILLSPGGYAFNQAKAEKLSSSCNNILLICGRYEGIDQRAIDLVVDEEISVGDFVVTGGELPALIVIDAISRLIPGVLGDETSSQNESFGGSKRLLEHPHYTRPPDFEGHKIPDVLLSGNHQSIETWREAESLNKTKKNRPDLLK